MEKNFTQFMVRALHDNRNPVNESKRSVLLFLDVLSARIQPVTLSGLFLLFLLLYTHIASAQAVSGISPQCGNAGAGFEITIEGTDFNTTEGVVTAVLVNNNPVDVLTVSETQIVADVPGTVVPTVGVYEVVVQQDGVEVTTSQTLTIIGPPTASAVQRCGPGEITLTASGAPTGAVYQWYTPAGGVIQGATNSTYTIQRLSETATYSVSMTAADGCESVKTSVEAIVLVATATVAPSGPLNICEGTSITLSEIETPEGEEGYGYQWYDGNTAIIGETGKNIIVSESGQYNVVVQTPNGCLSDPSEAVTVVVNPLPDAPSSVTTGARCGPGEVELSAAPGEGGTTIRWYSESVGGTLLETGLTFTTSLEASGIFYAATYNATTGCESERSRVEANVNPLPTATIEPVAPKCQNPISGETTNFILTGAAFSGTFLRWEVVSGNAEISKSETSEFTPTVSVTGAGTVRVSLTVASSSVGSNCDPAVAFIDLVVNPIAEAYNLDAPPVSICGSGQVTLAVSGAPDGYTYNWYDAPNGGNLISTGASYKTSVTQTTTFYVAVTGGQGCDNPNRTGVTAVVNPVPAAPTNVRASPAALCGPGSSTLSATAGTNESTIRWYSSSSGGTLLETNLTYAPTVSATTTFYAASYNATTGCESSTRVPVTVSVNSLPATPTISNLTAGKTYYTGQRYNNNYYFTLTGSAPPAGGTGVFSGPGVTFVNGVYRFTPCNALESQDQSTIEIKYTVKNADAAGGCESSTAMSVVVKRSTYTLVLEAAPFPVCPSVNTSYTAKVYRDAVVVYPAPENIRTQPINVVSNEEDVSSLFKIESGIARGDETPNYNRGASFSNSSLSSEDFYMSRAAPNRNALPSCVNVSTLLSNRIYLGIPEVNINMTGPGSICPGTSVTFSATPGAFPGNLTYQWTVNGQPVSGATGSTFTSSTLQNGDKVAVNYNAAEGKCGTAVSKNVITMVVVTEQLLTGGGAYCAGSPSNLAVGLQNSQVGVSYQLRRGNTTVGSPVAGTGKAISFGNQTAGTYTVLPVSQNGVCSAFPGVITITETALPVAYGVTPTGGNSYCAGAGGVAIGMSNAEAGVTYTLLRGGTQVAIANRDASGAFSFGAFTAGTYSVTATRTGTQPAVASCPQSMLNSVTITENALPSAVTAVGGSYCAPLPGGTASGAPVTVTNSQSGVSYQLVNASGQSVGNTVSGTGSSIMLGPVTGGSYSVAATSSATGCPSVVANNVTVTANQRVEPLGDIIIYNESGGVIQESDLATGGYARFTAQTTFGDAGDAQKYTWYTGDGSEAGWKEVAGLEGPVYEVSSVPGGLFSVQVVVTANQNACYTVFSGTYLTQPVEPLPVEIIYLNASRQGNDVELEWATASEQDNTGFEVQVSEDGFNYRKLTFVPTKNGNASTRQLYAFTDRENGKHGTRYYRLKQVDTNGTFELFGPKAVAFGSVASQVIAFPNPFHDEVTLDIAAEADGEALITVNDAVGKQLMERKVQVAKGFTTEKLRMDANLPKGLYIIRTQVGGVTQYFKLIKE